LNMEQSIVWAHKTLNRILSQAKKITDIPKQYHIQMEQQLLVSGADRCLFTASNGEREGMVSLWYESDKCVRDELLAGWGDFLCDVADYKAPVERSDGDWLDAVRAYSKAKSELELAQSIEKAAKNRLIEVSGSQQAYGGGVSLTEVNRQGSVDNKAIYRDFEVNPEDYRGTGYTYWKVTTER